MGKQFLSLIDEHFEHLICGLCLSAMASCIMLQVILRLVFSEASAWAEEIAIYSMVAAVYFGASLGVKECAHIRILGLVQRLPRVPRLTCVIVADLLWLGFLIFLLVQSISYNRLLFETTFVSPGLGLEMRWPYAVVPFCIVLMCFRMAQNYYHWIKDNSFKGLPS